MLQVHGGSNTVVFIFGLYLNEFESIGIRICILARHQEKYFASVFLLRKSIEVDQGKQFLQSLLSKTESLRGNNDNIMQVCYGNLCEKKYVSAFYIIQKYPYLYYWNKEYIYSYLYLCLIIT